MDSSGTGYIYLTDSAVGMSGMYIFNNDCSNLTLANSGSPEACFVIGFSSQGVRIYNNTLSGVTQTTPQDLIRIRNGSNIVTANENNVLVAGGETIHMYTGSSITTSNYNVFGPPSSFTYSSACSCYWYFEYPDGTKLPSLSAWTTATGGLDSPNSQSINPMLGSNNVPLSGSPVIRAGTNLYSLAGCASPTIPGLGALCYDKPLTVGVGSATVGANTRPATGSWDGGAYQYSTKVTYWTPNLTAVSSGPTFRTFSWSGFPDGEGTTLDSSAVGQYVTFTINVAEAGTYDVSYSTKEYPTRGIAQLAINGTNVGTAIDQYAAGFGTYAVFDLGNYNFTTAGNYSFKFTVTGKNASSSDYTMAWDDIVLTR
jgi:hypothetical protein